MIINLPWKLDRYEKMVNSFIHSVYARPTPEQMKALYEWAHVSMYVCIHVCMYVCMYVLYT